MKYGKLKKVVALFLVCVFLFASASQAQDLTLIEKIKYKEVYITEPNGRETAALVNRFSNKVELSWAYDKWIEAPAHLQWCYENQRNVNSWVSMRQKRRKSRR